MIDIQQKPSLTDKPFIALLADRLSARGESTITASFRKNVTLTCRIQPTDKDSRLIYLVSTHDLKAQLDSVDDVKMKSSLIKKSHRDQYISSRQAIIDDEFVSLNRVASALHGPMYSINASNQYSVYTNYYLKRSVLETLLGDEWTKHTKQNEWITLRDAAIAANTAHLLDDYHLKSFANQSTEDTVDDEEDNQDTSQNDALENATERFFNRIWFGPPGTGKSWRISQKLKELGIKKDNTRRIMFHPETTYFDLVGSYRPTVMWEDPEKKLPRTFYKFVPGPFSEILVASAKKPDEDFVLIIEEINRGNCAAIFGDVFQLLDRINSKPSDSSIPIGTSEYAISPSPEWLEWLDGQEISKSLVFSEKAIRMPSNLLLFASMNTSDQSLFPMDTAFKRRWTMEYVSVSAGSKESTTTVPINNTDDVGVSWRNFYRIINREIVRHTGSDDKQMGHWFVRPSPGRSLISPEEFCSKVLHYLWSDVFKSEPNTIFNTDISTYDQLVERYNAASGKQKVFNDTIHKAITETMSKTSENQSKTENGPNPEHIISIDTEGMTRTTGESGL